MHYSAKRGIAIACHLSVCLSVTLVNQDHIGWKSWKLITRTILRRSSNYSEGNMGNFEETRGGVVKSGVLEHKSGHI